MFALVLIILSVAFVLAVLGSWRSPGNELHFYRGGAWRWSDPQRAEAWKTKRIECYCSRKWRLLAEQGLAPLRKKRFSVSQLDRFSPTEPRSLLHAVGRAVSSAAGLQLEIASEEELSEPMSHAARALKALQRGPDPLTLLGSEELHRREAVVTIIQGEPLTEWSTRSQSDRESAALLRALGGELFSAGAEAVLVLPSLHAPIAEVTLRVIAKKLASWRLPSLHRMLDAVALARKTIRDWPAPPPIAANAHELEWFRHDQLEAALDICLFARYGLPPPSFETTEKA